MKQLNLERRLLDSVLCMLQYLKPKDTVTVISKGDYQGIKVGDILVMEVDDYLVHQYFSKLELETDERIALAKLCDSLQFVESQKFKTKSTY